MGFPSAALSIPSSSPSLVFFHRTPRIITSSSSTRNSRPNNTRKPTLKKASPSPSSRPKSNSNPNSLRARNLSYGDGGGEATTYTRLPPKDEDASFLVDPSLSAVISLHESVIPKVKTSPFSSSSEATMMTTISQEEEQLILSSDFDDEDEYEEDDDFESSLKNEEDDAGSNSNAFTGKTKESAGTGLGFGDEEDCDDSGEEAKEKGVPAVMRCFDRAKIYVKAGDGGNGVVAFRREKFVPYGGPSGGDGGKGGDVYVEVDGSMNSLLPFRKNIHFRAGRGSHGQGKKQAGAKGEDVVVKVAPGTLVREAVKGEAAEGDVLLELVKPGDRALLLPGGRGGKGNASFKSGTNKVPKIAENGEEGAEMWLDLELKLVADVGIVGAPNAGKSTLLSAISAAKPSIANYPFTTLLPNLGVVYLDFDATMVVADLPGLLEGAHQGFGLGHEFLRHTERCSVLVHVVDGSSLQPEYEFDAVRLELELFSPGLAEKPYIVAYNKMDLPEASEKWFSFKRYLGTHGIHTFCMSAMNRQGTHDIVCAAYELLQKEAEEKKNIQEWTNPRNLNYVAESIQKQRSASMNNFEIVHDSTCNTWHVVGAGVERFVQMTNWKYTESLRRFQHALEACGVNKSLIRRGVKEGDTVIVGEMEMVWHNATQQFGASCTRNQSDGYVKWPQFK